MLFSLLVEQGKVWTELVAPSPFSLSLLSAPALFIPVSATAMMFVSAIVNFRHQLMAAMLNFVSTSTFCFENWKIYVSLNNPHYKRTIYYIFFHLLVRYQLCWTSSTLYVQPLNQTYIKFDIHEWHICRSVKQRS